MESSTPEMRAMTAEKTCRAIGRFMFEFSQLEYSLRHYLGEEIGLDEKYFEAIINYEFWPLCNTFKSVFERSRPESAGDIGRLVNECLSLNNERNRVAHGLWVVHREGGAIQHVSRQSFKSTWSVEQAEALERKAEKACELRGKLEDIFWRMEI
jgi:hypothetical protein